MSKINCLVCNSQKYVKYHFFESLVPPFQIYLCNECRCLFQDTKKIQYQDLYGEQYYQQTQEYSYFDERKYHKACQYVYNARLKNIRKFNKEGNFLDIGCSFGGFVKSASKYFNAYGLDVSSYVVKEANEWLQKELKNKKTSIFTGDLNKNLSPKKIFKSNFFDVISLIEVAEHLTNPIDNFTKIFDLLKPKGMLVIQTANFDAWQAIKEGKQYHYFCPGHTVYYRATALKKMLKNIGFSSFKEYFPTDFSCVYKLLKSRLFFNKISDYKKWLGIIYYHYKSKLTYQKKPLTSSYVLYAFK